LALRDATLQELGAAVASFKSTDLEPIIAQLGLERAGRKAFGVCAQQWAELDFGPMNYEVGSMNLDAAFAIARLDAPFGRPRWWNECLQELEPVLWQTAHALASGIAHEEPETSLAWARKFSGLCTWAAKEGLTIPKDVQQKAKLTKIVMVPAAVEKIAANARI